MPTPFPRTMRSLAAEGATPRFLIPVVLFALLAAWVTWSVLASIPVYEVSDLARVEAERAAHPIEAPITGRVESVELVLGRRVTRGERLLKLDTGDMERAAAEEEQRRLAAQSELVRLRAQLEAERAAVEDAQRSAESLADEAKARHDEALASARLAEAELRRMEELHRDGNASDLEHERAIAERDRTEAQARTAEIAIERVRREQSARLSERRADVEELERLRARLDGEIATSEKKTERLRYEIERRELRAPVDGVIGDLVDVRAGSVVLEGTRIASIIPDGGLRAVADFAPTHGVGRIRVGQSARLRFPAYPWSQYGTVDARVLRVGTEPRSGAERRGGASSRDLDAEGATVRVELEIEQDPRSAIPLQHGLPATAEILVDSVSPAALFLRNTGRKLTALRGPGDHS